MVTALDRSTRGFNCRNCGAAVPLRALHHTIAVACASCGAILDPRDPNLVILQEAGRRMRVVPVIPLGTRGRLDNHPFEVIGFQRRSITVDDVHYYWQEYVLFNPYYGFRYLSEYENHWNVIRTVHAVPVMTPGDSRAGEFAGDTYRHFQSARATTEYVLGEFPWRVRVGDTVDVADYIAPPKMLSSETTDDETTWSIGDYTSEDRVREMFSLPPSPGEATGVFANQPSPFAGQPRRYWTACAVLLAALLAVFVGREAMAGGETVFSGAYRFNPAVTTEPAFVTPPFPIKAPGTLQVSLATNVRNNWVYLDMALIDTTSGTALEVGREISYYSGVDSDGNWTEGSPRGTFRLPRVAAGEYYLRVQPETPSPVEYSIAIQRDVPSLVPYGIALILILLPPALVSLRSWSFERRRWAESDHAPISSSGGGDDDDD